MKPKTTQLLITLSLVILAGIAGSWIGVRLLSNTESSTHDTFHENLFRELRLSDSQNELLEVLEKAHEKEIQQYRSEIIAANQALADSLEINDEYNEEVEADIANVHSVTFELQKITVRHLYQMREILNPSQKVIFDRQVSDHLREYTY